MNREDIIRMAREVDMDYLQYISPEAFEKVVRFAALVASAERERLANVFDERDKGIGFYDTHEPAEIIRGQA